jgi:hypothetical protein
MSVSETEVASACFALRDTHKEPPDRHYIANMLEAQQGEISRLRQVIRCADYFIVAGQDLRYDEARQGLVKYDRGKT